MTLGQKIREARQSKGMTQKELVGDYITRNMLSKIENDSAIPSVRTLEYLAGALGFPTGYFLSGAPVSDGTAPDGLDEARAAYREHRWNDCLTALEADNKAGTTDEGYLLHALAGAAAPPGRPWTQAVWWRPESWRRTPSITIRRACTAAPGFPPSCP